MGTTDHLSLPEYSLHCEILAVLQSWLLISMLTMLRDPWGAVLP